MEKFNVEETNLICIYAAGSEALESRTEVIQEIFAGLEFVAAE